MVQEARVEGTVGLSSGQSSFTMWTGLDLCAGGSFQPGLCRAGNPTPRMPLPGSSRATMRRLCFLYLWSYLISRTSPGLAQVTAELPFLKMAARTPPLAGAEHFWPQPKGSVDDSQTRRPSRGLRPALTLERQPEALVLAAARPGAQRLPKPSQPPEAPSSNNTRAACFLFSVKTETQAQRLAEQKHLFPLGPILRVWSRSTTKPAPRGGGVLHRNPTRSRFVCAWFQDSLATGSAAGGAVGCTRAWIGN